MKNSFGYLSKRPKHSLIPNAPFASAMALTARELSSCVAIVPGLREAEADDWLTCRRPDAPGYEAPQFLWEAAGLDNEVMEFLVCSRQPRIMLRQIGEHWPTPRNKYCSFSSCLAKAASCTLSGSNPGKNL
jgi:hypothetical protein